MGDFPSTRRAVGYKEAMRSYEIRCGERVVHHVESHEPRYAITDYLRSLGCTDDEIEPLSSDAVAWRGAVYTARAVDANGDPSRETGE
jgi:hypothetical protein